VIERYWNADRVLGCQRLSEARIVSVEKNIAMGECRTFGLTGSSGGELNVDGIQTVEALFGGRQGVVCSQPGKIEKLLPVRLPAREFPRRFSTSFR
jgi:hypothetical protein